MSRLPKRPLFYIVALLLVFLVALAIFLTKAVTSPELQEAMEEKRERAASVDNGEVKMPGIPPVETGVMAEASIDPYLKELVAPLNGPEGTP